MSSKARLIMIYALAALLAFALSNPALASIEPMDPTDPEPDYGPNPSGEAVYADQSTMADSTASGVATLYPGGGVCSVAYFANRISFNVSVSPNQGSPKAKITVWRASNRWMYNAELLDRAKRTGPESFVRSYAGTGFYQICFKYPWSQAVAPGSAFDFMNIHLFVNWR